MTAPEHARSYYAATANTAPERPALVGEMEADVCVVGGGFSGLSAALHLAERGYDVALVEGQRLGWGASGRNGGQLHSGQRIAASHLVDRFGREEAKRLWGLAEEAKAIVAERIARHDIACDQKRGLLVAAAKPGHVAAQARDVACMEEVFGYREARCASRDEVAEMVATSRYHGGVVDQGGGHIHPLNYALGLAAAAEHAGARLYEGSPATSVAYGPRPRVRTPGGSIRARHVVVCCNGYLARLEPRIAGKIMPIDNYILATEPLGDERAQALLRGDVAVSDTLFVVNYFRLSADKRLLFGGGETYSGRPPRRLADFVRQPMLKIFPQLAESRIDYVWGGQLAITMNRLPHFGRLGDNAYFAQGFSGQGVALTSLAGKLIAEAVAGTAERFDVFARIPHRNFPGGTLLRYPGLVLGMLYYSLRDRL
jgi:gamma-glutamylputrescine oxidase